VSSLQVGDETTWASKKEDEKRGPRAWRAAADEAVSEEDVDKAPPFAALSRDIEEDRLILPTSSQFIHYSYQGTIGKAVDGGLVIQDDDGLLVIDARDCDEEIDELLRDLAMKMKAEEISVRRAERFWKRQARAARSGSLTFQVNTMYKRKDKKVNPVDSSSIIPDPIGGRADWKERAKAKQRRNSDSEEREFSKYLIDRYWKEPRGTRLTPERIDEMKISPELWPRERQMLIEMLYRREPALSWSFNESGTVSHDVMPPVRIQTVPHTAWQEGHFPIPRKLRDTVIDMIQQRLSRGTLEYSQSPYRNPWFLVKKKDAGYRLINNAQRVNGVTLRDANLPPNPDEFSEEFAGCHIVSLIDFFSGYDQVDLHPDSRPMTAFWTPLGLVQQCTLPMGTTNSVAQFVRIVTKILRDQIPHRCMPYMDDIAVKGPKSNYGEEEVEPGLRRYIVEHICNIDHVLADMELAGCTASGAKSDWCFPAMGIVGYVVDKEGRHPAGKKVAKIVEWPPCACPKDVRMFLGVCVYYRIWIQDFARHAQPLFELLRKNKLFEWSSGAAVAMEHLKKSITTAPALISVDYSEPLRIVVISVDGSKKGWGAVLQQLSIDGKMHPVRFESGVWSKSEQNWDSGKHECKAMLLALKRFRPWIYGIHFTVETDSRTLIAQLNRSATDLPGSLITRWLALLNLWEFDIRHVEGKKNVVADALSRRPEPEGWEAPDEPEEDVEDFIDAQLGFASINSLRLDLGLKVTYLKDLAYVCYATEMTPVALQGLQSTQFRDIASWLATLKMPEGLSSEERRKIRRNARHFRIIQGVLWMKPSGDRPLRRVVDDPTYQQEIITSLHDESGHRGVEGTWRKVASRYYWDGIYKDVKEHVRTCRECQAHTTRRYEEELHPTWGDTVIWGWVTMDVVYMPDGLGGKKFLVVARDYTSGWVEAKALTKNDSGAIAQFLEEYIFSRWGIPYKLSVDGGPENKGLVDYLAAQFGIKRVVSSAYHPQGQGLIERGHKEIIGALRKMRGNWVQNLPRVLWADRVTVKRSTGETPAYLICGREHVLPIELCIPTWQTLPWDEIHDTESLLAARAKQFEKRDVRLREAVDRSIRLREQGKEWFDAQKNLRPEPLQVGDLVLVRDTFGDMDMSRHTKLNPRWKGPFRVKEKSPNDMGWYQIEDLNGVAFRNRTPGNRVIRFYQRRDIDRATRDETDAGVSTKESDLDAGGGEQEEEYHVRAPEKHSSRKQEIPIPLHTRRRSKRVQERYGQDIPRKAIGVVIPARNRTFNPADFEFYDKIEEE
jgi:hypothetical protein